MVAAAVVGGAVIGGVMSSQAQGEAASTAAAAQDRASQASIAQQNYQFSQIQKLLAPYASAGTGALGAQQNLIGLGGTQAQQSAINAIAGGPQMSSLIQQGENAILQNAAATGGLRGGNTQAALAQFRPAILNELINQQYANLGGLSSLGQNAAAMTGNAGMQTALANSAALQQAGAAQAQGALAAGRAQAQMWNTIGSAPAAYYGFQSQR